MKNLRNLLTELIAENPRCNAKKYYNLIRHSNSCTYQGVHKTLRQMAEEGVLVEREKCYSLSPKWLSSNIAFSKDALKRLEDSKSNYFEYESFMEFSQEFIKVLEKLSKLFPKEVPCVNYWQNAWPPQGLVGDSFQRLNNVVSNSTPILCCAGDSPGDRRGMAIYGKAGCTVKTGFKLPDQKTDWLARGTDFIQVIFPSDFSKRLRAIYAKPETGQTEVELIRLLHSPAKISVIITVNEKLARKYADKVLSRLSR